MDKTECMIEFASELSILASIRKVDHSPTSFFGTALESLVFDVGSGPIPVYIEADLGNELF
jgi:hypothetical protein